MRFLRRHERTGLAGLPVAGDESLGGLADCADGPSILGVSAARRLEVQDTPERLTPSYTTRRILLLMRESGVREEHPGGGGTLFTEPLLYLRKPSLLARARGAFAPGLPSCELYDTDGSMLGAFLVEASANPREDGGWIGWTHLVDLDRQLLLAWRQDVPTSAMRSLLGVGEFIWITAPDDSEIGTVGPVNLHGPGSEVPLALRDAAGTTIGSVEEKERWGRFDVERAIVDANGVAVAQIKTFWGTSSVIAIEPAMPEVLRPFLFPLEDLFREWGTPDGGPVAAFPFALEDLFRKWGTPGYLPTYGPR
jgi:hypothetical protein